MNSLPKAFKAEEEYRTSGSGKYQLLPFRFHKLKDDRYFLSNEVGDYLIVSRSALEDVIAHRLHSSDNAYLDFKSKHFLTDPGVGVALDLLALKLRTRKSLISRFTSLAVFVVTLRCDYSCSYCQVSRKTTDKKAFDMTEETARKALNLAFKTPSPQLKIEFQGGESLLNFPLIKFIVKEAKIINEAERKDLAFVIATNLSYLTPAVVQFCSEHNIHLSTSLDGPADIHNRNRPRTGKNGYQLTVDAIRTAQRELGEGTVSALMTTTAVSLDRVREIIDEYVNLGFPGIFLRPLSPYGFAVRGGSLAKYNMTKWLEFYKEGLRYILELNSAGTPFREYYTSLLLKRLLTHQPTTYVDLQSPAGIGISAVVFNYDGDVYASDESRMLAEMGDKSFRLGNVHEQSYEEIFLSDALLDPLEQSVAESAPMCADCAFLPYCGADPVYHHATQGDYVGHKMFSGFCARSMGMLEHLINLLEAEDDSTEILKTWAY